MGAYLSEPVLEKHSEDGEGKFLTFGSSSMQGWRVSQEVGRPTDTRYSTL
jgi:protein phosphatase 2C family protein 2/3